MMANNNQVASVLQSIVPEPDDTVTLFQSRGGHLINAALTRLTSTSLPNIIAFGRLTIYYNVYRIAGNFRGSKLSRIRPKNHFHEFYYSAILYRIIYNFRESQKIAKRAKVIGLESFRLYGNSSFGKLAESIQTLSKVAIVFPSGNSR